MQYFSGLVNLRAINILRFRNDTCIWVMREIVRFLVDNLSHHPELKLEWIAMEYERVDPVIRPSEAGGGARERQRPKRSEGKGKAEAAGPYGATSDGEYPPAADGRAGVGERQRRRGVGERNAAPVQDGRPLALVRRVGGQDV